MTTDCGFRYSTVVLVLLSSLYAVPAQDNKNNAQLPASDFASSQQQPAYDPSYQLDPSSYPTAQRLAGNSAYFSGLQPGQQQQAQAQQQQPGAWTGEMADLSQVLAQNVVAPQVNQFQQGQPDPLAASPYHTLLKNLASTAPLYPPGPPAGAAADNSRLFPGQLISPQAGLDVGVGADGVEKLDPPGPPHPPLNVENANYLTAVASIPQRIGSVNFNPSSLPGAFPHQTFQPNAVYTNRGQNPPPPFNPWPAQFQSSSAQQIQQQQQQAAASLLQQQQQQQQQQHFGVQQQQQQQQQLRMAANVLNQQQRHPQSSLLQNSPPAETNNNAEAASSQATKVDTVIVGQQQQQQVNKSESDEMLKAIITKQVYELKIVSYGQTACQVCEDTDKILRNYSMPVHTFRTDAMANGVDMLRIIKKQTGSKDMPQVFICGHFVGGYRKVKDLHKNGELKNLIKRCSN